MTIDEIRRNAPDGATHYRVRNKRVDYYIKSMFGFNLRFDDNKWSYSSWCGWNKNIKPL